MPHVHILMASYDGARHIGAQLDSYLRQSHDDWSLTVSDDGSRDATRDIVATFRKAHRERDIELVDGPRRGSAQNFLSLLERARPGAAIAFSDQDDVWMPHKLERALDRIGDRAAIHTGCTILTDRNMGRIATSPMPRRGTSFGNALVQNVLAGNMLVLSPGAVERTRPTLGPARDANVPFHDWWIYLAASGMGLEIDYDAMPGLYYRQHGQNVLGSSRGAFARLARLRLLLSGTYSGWIARNLAALGTCRPLLAPEAAEMLARLEALRVARWPRGRGALAELGVRRQNAAEDRLLDLLLRAGRL